MTRTNVTWRNSRKVYLKKPATNCAAARAAWLMIERTTGKEVTSLRLENGSWKATFYDGMTGQFNHTPELTRTSIRQTRAADRLRAAVAQEKNELWEKAIAAELGAGTNGQDHDHPLEPVH